MATMSLSPQKYQQMIYRIAGLESMMTNPQSHAESQQEQIRLAELVIQQLRIAGTPTNPPPPTRGTSQKQVTEGGSFKALTKHVGKPPSTMIGFSAPDEFSQERTRDLLDCYSGSREPSMRSRRVMCLRIEERRISARWTCIG